MSCIQAHATGMQPFRRRIHADGFHAKWRANQAFLVLMPLVLIGARLVHRRRRGDDAAQNEKSEV